MDLLLESFLDECYAGLSGEQQAAFTCLLEESDVDILDWVQGKTRPADGAYLGLIQSLQARMRR
jgi:succinate dehydrogenase flavin-adding protein (antitoxin of CptAB toxin-antitoxin module)